MAMENEKIGGDSEVGDCSENAGEKDVITDKDESMVKERDFAIKNFELESMSFQDNTTQTMKEEYRNKATRDTDDLEV